MKIYYVRNIFSSLSGVLKGSHPVLGSISLHRSRIDGWMKKVDAKPHPKIPNAFTRQTGSQEVIFKIVEMEVDENPEFVEI